MARALRKPNAAAVTPLTGEQEELYQAYSASYGSVGARRRYEFIVDGLFAFVALVIVSLSVFELAEDLRDTANRWIPLVTLLWLGVRESRVFGNPQAQRMEAVNLQEQFDLSFWKGQDWRSVWNGLLLASPVPRRTVKERAASFRGETISATYWVDTSALTASAAALARIMQSAGWGERGHRRYADLNSLASVAGLVVLVVYSAVGGLDTLDLAAATMAVAPILTGRRAAARAHRNLSQSRRDLEAHAEQLLLGPSLPSDQDVRSAQDELVRLRLEDRRIPEWLYRRYKERDEQSIDSAALELVGRAAVRP